MINILIVDDERRAQKYLAGMVSEIPGCHVSGFASNGIEAVNKASQLDVDIVLMDIRLPLMDGIEAAKYMSESYNPPKIIFTTAYTKHALSAFAMRACGYILKPVLRRDLEESIFHARKSISLCIQEDKKKVTQRQHICFRGKDKIYLVPTKDIIFFKSRSKYTLVKHTKGEELMCETLIKLEKDFSGSFFRVHRDTLVNSDYLDTMEKDSSGRYFMRLKHCADRLLVSRRHVSDMRRRMKRFSKPKSK